MIIGFKALEDMIESFLKERPEAVHRSVVEDLLWKMCSEVMIRNNRRLSVELRDDMVSIARGSQEQCAYLPP
jgi:hypothetical protein